MTVRRWTATGLLPCVRTPGGHRRIALEDIEEVSRAAGSHGRLAARRARERELDTLIETVTAVAGETDLNTLLVRVAKAVTQITDTDFCAVSEYDPTTRHVRALAEYDATGKRLPDPAPCSLREYPLTRRVLEEQEHQVVNVDDRFADAAEVAELRRGGDCSLLMLPLVVRGESIGLIEATDRRRSRTYQRQELRLCRAVAYAGAVALDHARALAKLLEDTGGTQRLRDMALRLRDALPAAVLTPGTQRSLQRLAQAVCDACEAHSCVLAVHGRTAGASRAFATDATRLAPPDAAADVAPRSQPDRRAAEVLVARDPSGLTDLTITLAVDSPPVPGAAEVLGLAAAAAAAAWRGGGRQSLA